MFIICQPYYHGNTGEMSGMQSGVSCPGKFLAVPVAGIIFCILLAACPAFGYDIGAPPIGPSGCVYNCPDDYETNSGSTSGGSSYVSGPSCNPGYHIYSTSGGYCCPDGYPFYFSGQCHQCQQGYHTYATSASHCCPEGFPHYYNGRCYQCSQGSYRYTTSAGKCCPRGYPYFYNGKCWHCSQGNTYDAASGMCCPGEYPFYYNGKCYPCREGYAKYDTSAGNCCEIGYPFYFNGRCWRCQEGSTYDEASGTCCKKEFPFYYNGKCHQCREGYAKYDTSGGMCCPEGYLYYYEGKCHTRPDSGDDDGDGIALTPVRPVVTISPSPTTAVIETTPVSVTVTTTRVSDRFVAMPGPLAMPYTAIRDFYESMRSIADSIWQRGLLRPAEGSSHPAPS